MNLIPYIKACYPVLYLVTAEEGRGELMILNACKELKRNLKVWSHTEGFTNPLVKEEPQQIEDPVTALNQAKNEQKGTILVMRDLHQFLTIPKTIRQVRDIARDFKQTQKTLIIISPVKKIPPELERDVTVLEFDLPKKEDIEQIWTALYEGNKKKIGDIDADEQERIVQAAMGLTTVEAEAAFAKALVENATNGTKETPISILVMKEKANAVKKSGILEYFEAKQTADDIGGLENLKHWLMMRSRAFSKQAREFGLPMPRGILLAGLPGCGKSLAAKAASNILGVPLLRFDIGRVFGGLVGQSESNMRLAIQTAEAVGRSVLWIDEMEKAFAGMGGSGTTDGGTSQRVFGNFITWMQEKTIPCFVIACMDGKTVVAQPNGCLTPIKYIKTGEILSADWKKASIVSTNSDLKVTPIAKKIVEISSSCAYMECTPNHPLFVCDADANIIEKPAGHIEVGDRIAAPLSLPEANGDVILELPDVAKQAKTVNLPDTIDADLAYWLGYTTGDGGVLARKRIQWSDKDHCMATTFVDLSTKIFATSAKLTPRKDANGYHMRLDSSVICDWIDLNFPEAVAAGGPNRSIPQKICMSNNEIVGHFIAGFIDAEGDIGKRRINVTTTSYILAQQLSMLMCRLGITASLQRYKSKTSFTKNWIYRLHISSKESVMRFKELIKSRHDLKISRLNKIQYDSKIRFGSNGLLDMPIPRAYFDGLLSKYNLPQSILPYYRGKGKVTNRQIFQAWIAILESFGATVNELEKLHRMMAWRWDAIKSARHINKSVDVYDLRVPSHENYIAGNLIVHNTVNRIESLPPELLRKGRFDETFFVGLPNEEEREAIIKIHIQKYKRDIKNFDKKTIGECVKASKGFSGAELEEAVITGLYVAFHQERDLAADDLLRAIKDTNPLSKSKKEELDRMAKWAESNAINASKVGEEKKSEQQAGRQLEI